LSDAVNICDEKLTAAGKASHFFSKKKWADVHQTLTGAEHQVLFSLPRLTVVNQAA